MTTILSRPDQATAAPTGWHRSAKRPGIVEKTMVVATTFVLLHGLPIDWLRSRADFLGETDNAKMVVAQLFLMLLGIVRVIGSLDWIVRVIRLDVPLFLFAGLTMVSMLWSADPGVSMRQGLVFCTVTMYGAYLILRFDVDEILNLLALMFVAGGVVNLAFVLALPQFAVDSGFWDGVFFQKNALGFSATLAIPTLIVAARCRPQLRFGYYGTILVYSALLLGSQSKTMLVATIASVALLVTYRLFRGRRTLRGAVLLSLAGTSLFTAAFATANISVLADWLGKDVSLTGRVPLWLELIPLIGQRPWLGHGYRAVFGGYFSPVHEVLLQAGWSPSHAHNAIIQTWLELGIVGVGLFLFTFVRSIKRAVHVVNLVPSTVGLWPLMFLSSTLLISITESGISHTLLGWLMYVVAILAAANQVKAALAARSAALAPANPALVADRPLLSVFSTDWP